MGNEELAVSLDILSHPNIRFVVNLKKKMWTLYYVIWLQLLVYTEDKGGERYKLNFLLHR